MYIPVWKILLLNPCIYKSDFTRVTYTCKTYKCNFFIELTPGLYILWFMVGSFISHYLQKKLTLASGCINETFKNYLKPFWESHSFTEAKNSQLRFGAQSQEKHTHERRRLNQKEKSPILVSRGRVVEGRLMSCDQFIVSQLTPPRLYLGVVEIIDFF